jgi:AcrR family transcriptional regulator
VVHTGKSQRSGYHHGDLANALIAAAAQLARDGGPEAVVLREAARKVGVSATAAYRHFSGYDELIHAVKQCAQGDLVATMRAELTAPAPVPDRPAQALRRLRALGNGYLHFALSEPGLFRTAFAHTIKPGGHATPEHTPAATAAFQLLTETLDKLAAEGLLDAHRRPHADIFACSCVHGLALLLLDGPLSALPAEMRDDVIRHGLDAIQHGLTAPHVRNARNGHPPHGLRRRRHRAGIAPIKPHDVLRMFVVRLPQTGVVSRAGGPQQSDAGMPRSPLS